MSDIQRWDMNHVQGEVYIDKKPEGSWVTYADHLAAVAAAEQQGFHRGWATAETYWREVSIRYGRRKVREAWDAVAALIDKQPTTAPGWVRRDEALAAIDALLGESNG